MISGDACTRIKAGLSRKTVGGTMRRAFMTLSGAVIMIFGTFNAQAV
jgi:hypothetical protein